MPQRKPLILVSLLLAAFAINLDTTIVNVALPTLVRELHASNTQLQWVVDAYNLVFAASLLAAGSLSDRLGRKGMLLGGLAVFGLGSLAGGLTDEPGTADRRALRDGPRRGDGVPGHAVAAHERLHRATGARPGDRAVGRDHGRGDRARADLRRVAARGVRLDEHLLRDGPGGRNRRRAGREVRADLTGPARARGPTAAGSRSRRPRSRCSSTRSSRRRSTAGGARGRSAGSR